MRRKPSREKNSTDLLRLSSSRSLAGPARRGKDRSKPTRIMTAKLEKTSILSPNGIKEGRY